MILPAEGAQRYKSLGSEGGEKKTSEVPIDIGINSGCFLIYSITIFPALKIPSSFITL